MSFFERYNAPRWLFKYLGKEDVFTIEASDFLRFKRLLHHHTFNEAKRSRTNQSKIKGFGVMTGIPDFLIFESRGGFKGLAIELKVIYENGKKNVLSKNQKEAQKELSARGWYCVTVWDFREFEREVNNYLKIK